MPYTPVQIINMGLGKFASARVRSIAPPSNPLETHCDAYWQWRESELSKRRWVFAHRAAYDLPYLGDSGDSKFPYKYDLPPNVLRPIRTKGATWRQEGRKIIADVPDLEIPVTLNVPEAEFDPLFIDVLAVRVWIECVGIVRQSNSGKEEAEAAYIEAVREAAKANAFVIGPESIIGNDDAYDFIIGRDGFV